MATASALRGRVLIRNGRCAEGLAQFAESIETYRGLDAPGDLALTLMELGVAHLGLGDVASAHRALGEAVEISRQASEEIQAAARDLFDAIRPDPRDGFWDS